MGSKRPSPPGQSCSTLWIYYSTALAYERSVSGWTRLRRPKAPLVTNCPKIAFSLEGEHAMAVADRNGGRIAIRHQPGSIIYVVPMG